MHDRMVVQFALVPYRRENIALQQRGVVEDHQRLVRVAGEDHLVKRLLHAVFVLDHDAGRLAIHLSDRPVEVDLVPEIGRQVFVDMSGSLVPRLHRGGGFDIKEFEISRKERCGHIKHIGRHQEVDEHGFQYLVPEVPGETGQIQDRPHADVVERIEGVQKFRLGPAQPTEPLQTPQDSLKLYNLGLQLLSDVGVEIVGVNTVTVLHAVTESGIDQFNAKLFHQQQDMVIYRRNAGGDGNIEGNGTAVILRHIGSDRIPANPVLRLKQPEIESVRVVMQHPCRPQP